MGRNGNGCVWVLWLGVLCGCPIRPMPCNTDADCDGPRSLCDTTEPQDDAAGTCVFRPLVKKSTSHAAGPSSSESAADPSSSHTPVECQPGCLPGQRCAAGLCVCDSQSCQAGCCLANRCELTGFRTCAPTGDTCLSCSMLTADNCGAGGGCRCGSQPACGAGQACVRGQCECFPDTCPGCCQGNQCQDRGVEACGVLGSLCVGCDPIRADGCSPQGLCRCGNGPPCGSDRACVAGNCVCNDTSCQGCCDQRVCNLASIVSCGSGGAACQECDPLRSDGCGEDGTCSCGTGRACKEGQECASGQCTCTQRSCGGCCNGTECEPGTTNALCGAAGLACEACAAGQDCHDGVCSNCTPQLCPDGCCSANTCVPRKLSTCGVDGRACEYCSLTVADACSIQGGCACGGGPACTSGQQCVQGSCTCNNLSCPNGCCQEGVCLPHSPEACGSQGSACVVCSEDRADYCGPTGQCQCGSDAPCKPGQRCEDGACLCDALSCPNGCCLGDTCLALGMDSCGVPGGLCVRCNPTTSNACRGDGTCGCGDGPACVRGQTCQDGACACNQQNCPHGCCANNVCVEPDVHACGKDGQACTDCGAGADGCGPHGTCRCGAALACASGLFCVGGGCQSSPGSSSSGQMSSSSTSGGSTSRPDASSAPTSGEGRSSSASDSTRSSSSSGPGSSNTSGSSSSATDPAPLAPVVTGVTPTNHQQPQWTWTSGGGGTGTYRYQLDDPDLASSATTSDTSFTPPGLLAEGEHTLFVQERNTAGLWSPSGSFTITVDITAPNAPAVSIVSPTTNLRPTWTWTSGGGGNGSYRYKMDDADLSTGATPTVTASATPASALGWGTHTLYVQEQDAAGNWSVSGSAPVSIEVDTRTWVVALGQAHRVLASPDLGSTWPVDVHDAPGTDDERTLSTGAFGNGTFVAGGGLFTAVGPVRVTQDMFHWSSATLASPLQTMAHGVGLFVGASHMQFLATSTDGQTWTDRVIDTEPRSMAYGNGMFLVVGDPAQGFSRSVDGITWELSGTPNNVASIDSVAFGAGRFVAVGCGSGSVVTEDGVDFQYGDTGNEFCKGGITYGNGIFMADNCQRSLDGLTWEAGWLCGDGTGFRAVTFGGGFFFGASGGSVWRSPDGLVWTEVHSGASAGLELEGVVVGTLGPSAPNAPLVSGTTPTTDTTPTWNWVSNGGGGNGTFRYKLDDGNLDTGATLTTSRTFTPATALSGGTHTLYVQERNHNGFWSSSGSFAIVVNAGTTWVVAVGRAHRRLASSDLGVTWTVDEHDAPGTESSRTLTVGLFGNGVFVAAGGEYSTSGPVRYTTDMTTWNTASLTDPAQTGAVGAGLLVVGSNNQFIATSPTGATWTRRTVSGADVRGVAYGNGLFLTAGNAADGFARSTDGITWVTGPVVTTSTAIFTIAFGGGRFVAIGCGSGTVVTTDGQDFQYGDLGDDTCHSAITYGDGEFFTADCFRSPDGLSWTHGTCPDIFNSITYGAGYYFGASEDNVWRSPDGTSWTKMYGPAATGLELWGIAVGSL